MSAGALKRAETSGDHLAGWTLGRFRLSHEIARGGMASVYLGHVLGNRGVGRAVAVKVMHPHLAERRECVEMFRDEVRINSSIVHPNVCRILDYGRADGRYYLAMDYIQGETWARVLDRMKATPEARSTIYAVLTQVLLEACDGLDAAHEARDSRGTLMRVVHRDVSPENIIVGYDGRVRIIDFGIATSANMAHAPRAGSLNGRFGYMAPERMRELPVDRRADIWSLGVVLWEGLAQRRLFDRTTWAAAALAITTEGIPSLRDVRFPIPPQLAAISARALQRDPAARYATAREMSVELSQVANSLRASTSLTAEWMHRLFAKEMQSERGLASEALGAAETVSRGSVTPPRNSEIRALSSSRRHPDESSAPLLSSHLRRGLGRGTITLGVLAGVLLALCAFMAVERLVGGYGIESFALQQATQPIVLKAPTETGGRTHRDLGFETSEVVNDGFGASLNAREPGVSRLDEARCLLPTAADPLLSAATVNDATTR